jgi:5-methylcytosine-specific restriction protein A
VQVVPDYEADHVLGLACWCGPRIDDDGQLPLVSHRDIAERAGLPVDVWHADRLTVCATPGCPQLASPASRTARSAGARSARRPTRDARAPRQRGYDARWRGPARGSSPSHPTCECDACLELPMHERPRATDVDHRDGLGPRGPRGHDWSNLRAMSHEHHSRRPAATSPQDGTR